jgi:glycosyltransferase involved in cell wall biosynthesis
MKELLSAIKHQRDIRVIKDSQLFDESYYVTHYPEVLQSGLSPIEHYLKAGSAAGMRPNAFFDDAYYRAANPDVCASRVNPLVHFIKFGAREGRNPCRTFDTRFYLEKHPDVAATGVNPLWHFLTYGAAEHRETDNIRNAVLSAESRVLYDRLAEIEPLLPPFDDLRYVPLDRGENESLAGRAYFKLIRGVTAPFSRLFVMQRFTLGGASTLAMHYVNLVREMLGAESVMILLADLPDRTAGHLVPAGVRMMALDELQPGLSEEDKIQVLARFIVEMKPDVVHNLDSNVCWQAFQRFHRRFKPDTSLVASLYMFTYNSQGRKAGYATQYLNSCIDSIDLILTDNQMFKREAYESYALEDHNQDKIAVVYTPILSRFREPDVKAASSKRILWSSRLHYDKRPELLADIASRMPEFTFEVYGGSVLSPAEQVAIDNAKNIRLHGPYLCSEDLPNEGIGAYLHLTRHEGGAITLKEAIVAGVPVVAPPLGVIPEIVNPDTGWLVTNADDPAAYVEAIRDCLASPEERIRRIRNAQDLIKREHSWESFARAVTALPAYRLAQSSRREQLSAAPASS